MGVALLLRGLDGEKPYGHVIQPAAGRAEMATTVGFEREMPPIAAVAVEVDEAAAARALAHPVAMVAAPR